MARIGCTRYMQRSLPPSHSHSLHALLRADVRDGGALDDVLMDEQDNDGGHGALQHLLAPDEGEVVLYARLAIGRRVQGTGRVVRCYGGALPC